MLFPMFLVVFSSLVLPSASFAESAQEWIVKAVKAYRSVAYYQDKFQFKQTVPQDPRQSFEFEGEFAFLRPNKLRFSIRPKGQKGADLYADGQFVDFYSQDFNEYTRRRITPPLDLQDFSDGARSLLVTRNAVPAFLLSDPEKALRSLLSKTKVQVQRSKAGVLLESSFKPPKKGKEVERVIRFWLDPERGFLTRIYYREGSEQKPLAIIEEFHTNIQTSPPPGVDQSFQFTPPSSARSVRKLTIERPNKVISHPLLDKPAPPFEATDLTGKKWSLKDLQGNIVVLNFWATWCPPCVMEMPLFNRLSQQLKEHKILFFGVNDERELEKVKNFLKEKKISFPTLQDPDNTLSKAYFVEVLPTTIIIDAQGAVRAYLIGLQEREDILDDLEALGLKIGG